MRPRRLILNLLSVVALAVGGAGLSGTAAQASTDTVSVYYSQFGVSPNTNAGLVSVGIASGTPLTSLTVSIVTGTCSAGTPALTLPMTDFVQPATFVSGQEQIWTLSSPITTSQLSLGTYEACVSAADTGASVSNVDAGPLYYLDTVLYPGYSYSGRTSFSYDHQDTTFSGKAELLTPAGKTSPFADKTLTLAGEGASGPTTVTGSDGSFSLTFQVTQSGPYWLYYAGDSTTESNGTSTATFTVTQFPSQIKAALTKPYVKPGQPDSLQGHLTYTDGGVAKPERGATVWLCPAYDGYCDSSNATASMVTDASGAFSFPLPTALGGTTLWMVATPQTTYFQWVDSSAFQVIIQQPNVITAFHAHLNSFGAVTYSGCVTANSGDLTLEYATKQGGPWFRLGRTPAFTGTSCEQNGHYGNLFSGNANAKVPQAYYRVSYAATPNWQQAASSSAYLWKYLTKITSFSVTPSHVAKGGHITVSGRLWTRTKQGAWRPYGHRRVMVIFRYKGTWYRYRGEPKTNRVGRFSGRFPVYGSSPFFAQYNGDSTHFACASVRRRVTGASHLSPFAVHMPATGIQLIPRPTGRFMASG